MTPTFTSLSITDADSLEVLNANTAMETPDEMTRVHEFEERLKFALEQSLILQMKQMNQIDSLEKDLKVSIFLVLCTQSHLRYLNRFPFVRTTSVQYIKENNTL